MKENLSGGQEGGVILSEGAVNDERRGSERLNRSRSKVVFVENDQEEGKEEDDDFEREDAPR